MNRFFFFFFLFLYSSGYTQNSKRWRLQPDGGIQWLVGQESPKHTDHIEMSGLQMSSIITYGIDGSGSLILKKKLVFPMLRTIPNDTHASLTKDFDDPALLRVLVNGKPVSEKPHSFYIKGKLIIHSEADNGISIIRTLAPSPDKPALAEVILIKNTGTKMQQMSIENKMPVFTTDADKGVYGQYIVSSETKDTGSFQLLPGEEKMISVVYQGRRISDQKYNYNAIFEVEKRDAFVKEIFGNLILETPNDTINRAFAFAKLRATESIYDTRGGLMHGPGGGHYYAAIWANDQAEYANPFFPFLGNLNGNESALNSYRWFATYMNPEYKRIPSSIIAEGTGFWNGAKDRGDMAMIAYGASRYALALGDRSIAKELWVLIEWCINYLERQKTPEGLVKSDSDELEGRFPAGKINLATNCITYRAYIDAAYLADELKKPAMANEYRQRAKVLRGAIENYFGANIQGFETYRYYSENTKLRAWICLPLVMGIAERKTETIKALFSPYLWTSNGILTESGDKTFWDRATLYAFRGLFASCATNECMPYFQYYAATRLLGEHVPYPVEAWPEGGQRHLSAESALYCRVITEGLFGFEATGFKKFNLTPYLPKGWNFMRLKNIHAFGALFDIDVRKNGTNYLITIMEASGKKQVLNWNGRGTVLVKL